MKLNKQVVEGWRNLHNQSRELFTLTTTLINILDRIHECDFEVNDSVELIEARKRSFLSDFENQREEVVSLIKRINSINSSLLESVIVDQD